MVLTTREVRDLLMQLNGPMWLITSLLYGTGMRLLEALRLRVKDVEFERREIIIREGKGNKDQITVLPENLIIPLQAQLQRIKLTHDDVSTTMIYTHVLNKGGRGVTSPFDAL